jgi:hypothetical protein
MLKNEKGHLEQSKIYSDKVQIHHLAFVEEGVENVNAFDMRSRNSVLIGQCSTNYNIGRWSLSQVNTGGLRCQRERVLLRRRRFQINLDNMNRSWVILKIWVMVTMTTDVAFTCFSTDSYRRSSVWEQFCVYLQQLNIGLEYVYIDNQYCGPLLGLYMRPFARNERMSVCSHNPISFPKTGNVFRNFCSSGMWRHLVSYMGREY